MAQASSTDQKAEAASTTHHVPLLSGLLGSGKYSDLTLTCGSRSWKVHKGVLCLQSDFFAKACDGDFKEAHTNTIDLSDDSEFTIAAMVNFMYYGKYDAVQILPSEDYEGDVAMLLHVRVVGLAQRYFIEPLQKYAGGLASELMKQWDGSSSIFAESVFAIYTGTEDVAFGTKLRERAVEVVMDKALLLFGPDNEHLSGTRDILLHETPGFVEDWARAVSNCNDTLSAANANFEAVTKVVNDDNVKLNDRYKNLKTDFVQLKAEAAKSSENALQVSKSYLKVCDESNAMNYKMENMVSIPDKPTANFDYATTGPAPDLYKCPNCEVLFFRAVSWTAGFHHACFDYGWCGKLGKGGVHLSHTGWQDHLVRKACYPRVTVGGTRDLLVEVIRVEVCTADMQGV